MEKTRKRKYITTDKYNNFGKAYVAEKIINSSTKPVDNLAKSITEDYCDKLVSASGKTLRIPSKYVEIIDSASDIDKYTIGISPMTSRRIPPHKPSRTPKPTKDPSRTPKPTKDPSRIPPHKPSPPKPPGR